MYSRPQLALKYFRYYLTASNGKGHGIHSPFVFHFITKILNDNKYYPEYKMMENLRRNLLKDQTLLTIEDLGAGSSVDKNNQRSIATISKNAVKSKKYSQLLFRIVKEYKPKIILELGTSLGITTSYLAAANPSADVISIEAAREIAAVAKKIFAEAQLGNINLVEGNFDNELPTVIKRTSSIDLAFVDGNHRSEPTWNYFQQLLSHANNNSIFIFDDIYWSREMEKVWEKIKGHEAVQCSIDLFFMGIVFFRKELIEKQHFVIRF